MKRRKNDVRTSSPASTEGEAVRKLLTFSKEGIIEACLSVSPFLNVNSVISECKEIYRDNQFKMLMKRDEELSKQRCILANAQPGDIEEFCVWKKKMKKLIDEQNIIEKKIDRLLAR